MVEVQYNATSEVHLRGNVNSAVYSLASFSDGQLQWLVKHTADMALQSTLERGLILYTSVMSFH